MNKVTTGLFVFFMFFLTVGFVSSQEEEVDPQPVTIETENGVENIAYPADEVEITDDVSAISSVSFLIYTHEECPHCKNLEDFVTANGLDDYVIYKQLKDSDATLAELEGLWEKYEVSQAEEGWPFAEYSSGDSEMNYAVGDEPIIDQLISLFSLDDPVYPDGESGTTTGEDDNNGTLMVVLGGLFFLAVIGYGIYSYVSSPKDD